MSSAGGVSVSTGTSRPTISRMTPGAAARSTETTTNSGSVSSATVRTVRTPHCCSKRRPLSGSRVTSPVTRNWSVSCRVTCRNEVARQPLPTRPKAICRCCWLTVGRLLLVGRHGRAQARSIASDDDFFLAHSVFRRPSGPHSGHGSDWTDRAGTPPPVWPPRVGPRKADHVERTDYPASRYACRVRISRTGSASASG
jgi:hypothetical protein